MTEEPTGAAVEEVVDFFAPRIKIVRIDANNTITIRKISWDERQLVQQAMMKPRMNVKLATGTNGTAGTAGDQEFSADWDDYAAKKLLLKFSIIGWDGPGFRDRSWKQVQNIYQLPPDIIDLVLTAIDELAAPMSEIEKKE